eukprot:2780899-Rhodomonas_salina.3
MTWGGFSFFAGPPIGAAEGALAAAGLGAEPAAADAALPALHRPCRNFIKRANSGAVARMVASFREVNGGRLSTSYQNFKLERIQCEIKADTLLITKALVQSWDIWFNFGDKSRPVLWISGIWGLGAQRKSFSCICGNNGCGTI